MESIRIGVNLQFSDSEAKAAEAVKQLIDEHKLGEKIKELLVKEFNEN